jgi:hypothetical protein
MNFDNEVQDVVDAIERELFIRVPKGYGVQVSSGVYNIVFDEVLNSRDLEAVEEVAYDYAVSATDVYANKGGGQFVSSLTIRF